MLFSEAHIKVIAELLKDVQVPLVIDPVMISTSGSALLKGNAIEAYKNYLLPLATLITPNLPEANVLGDIEINSSSEMQHAAQRLSKDYKTSILLKGGHLPQGEDRLDVLHHEGKSHSYIASTIDILSTHGTGCTLSAAITANLANGANLPDSVSTAKKWVHQAIKNSFQWQKDHKKQTLALNQLNPRN